MFKAIHYCFDDVFGNFKNIRHKTYEFDLTKFLSAPGLAWQAVLNQTKVKLDPLSHIDILLTVKKGNRGWWEGEGICLSICSYTKANNKYMKHYDKNKES